VKVTTQLQLVTKSIKHGSLHPFPISRHGVVLVKHRDIFTF
jgi:hypothetical protein